MSSPAWRPTQLCLLAGYSAVLTAAILFLVVADVHGQTINQREVGAGYAHLISFAAEPEIAAATFTVDSSEEGVSDTDINSVKLPLYKEFESKESDRQWFAQATLSYLDMDSSVEFDHSDTPETIKQQWIAYGALIEGGTIVQLGSGFSLQPGLGFGISHLENSSRFSSALLEQELAPRYDGVIYNWDTNAAVARGNLALQYDRVHGNFRIKGKTNIAYSYIDSFGESERFTSFSDHASTFTLKVDVRHPLEASLQGHPLYIIGHLGNTTFIGSGRDQLDFNSFMEAGVSLGVEKLTLGVLAAYGDSITGWTLSFNYDY